MSNQKNADTFTPRQLIIFLIILFLLAGSALGIIAYQDHQIKKAQAIIDKQPTKITNVSEVKEQFETFKVSNIDYSESDDDFQQPTGVPATHVTITTTVIYSDGQHDEFEKHFDVDFNDNSDHKESSRQKYGALINKSFTRRTTQLNHYDITAVNLKTKKIYHLTSLESHQIGETQNVAKLNSFTSSYDSAKGNGSYEAQTRSQIIEQQPDN